MEPFIQTVDTLENALELFDCSNNIQTFCSIRARWWCIYFCTTNGPPLRFLLRPLFQRWTVIISDANLEYVSSELLVLEFRHAVRDDVSNNHKKKHSHTFSSTMYIVLHLYVSALPDTSLFATVPHCAQLKYSSVRHNLIFPAQYQGVRYWQRNGPLPLSRPFLKTKLTRLFDCGYS